MEILFRPKAESVEFKVPELNTLNGKYEYGGNELKIADGKVYIDDRGYKYEKMNPCCFECEIRRSKHIFLYNPRDGVLAIFKYSKRELNDPDFGEPLGVGTKIDGEYSWECDEDGSRTIIKIGKREVYFNDTSVEVRRFNNYAISTRKAIFGKKRIMVFDTENKMLSVFPTRFGGVEHKIIICPKQGEKRIVRRTFRNDVFGEWIWKRKTMKVGKNQVIYDGKRYKSDILNKDTFFINKFYMNEPYLLTYHTGDKVVHLGKLRLLSASSSSKKIGKKEMKNVVSSQVVQAKELEVEAMKKKYDKLKKIVDDVQRIVCLFHVEPRKKSSVELEESSSLLTFDY